MNPRLIAACLLFGIPLAASAENRCTEHANGTVQLCLDQQAVHASGPSGEYRYGLVRIEYRTQEKKISTVAVTHCGSNSMLLMKANDQTLDTLARGQVPSKDSFDVSAPGSMGDFIMRAVCTAQQPKV